MTLGKTEYARDVQTLSDILRDRHDNDDWIGARERFIAKVNRYVGRDPLPDELSMFEENWRMLRGVSASTD